MPRPPPSRRPRPTPPRIAGSLFLVALAGCGGNSTATALPGPNPDSPIVAGFERFHRDGSDLVAGGRLLLGELGCAACHGIEYSFLRAEAKPAPRLVSVAERVHAARLMEIVADPHGTKPGTTMPSVWVGVDDATRTAETADLVHFLVSLSGHALANQPFALTATDQPAAARGARLFDSIGCVACHAPASDQDKAPAHSVPLPAMANHYSLEGMRSFLRDPLAHRPGARMPAFALDDREALDLAHYLLRGTEVQGALHYTAYHGRFDQLEQLEEAEAIASGVTDSFDLGLGQRLHDFGLCFEGFLDVPITGEYSFYLSGDKLARLIIGGETVAQVRAHDRKPGRASRTRMLSAGMHPITVLYIERGGERGLSVEWAGPELERAPLTRTVLRHRREPVLVPEPFEVDIALAARGRVVFAARGCASCHSGALGDVAPATAPPFELLDPTRGCLGETLTGFLDYRLDDGQRLALRAALASIQGRGVDTPSDSATVRATLTRYNCYSCHERDGRGGIADDRDLWFVPRHPAMGEEGRVPPRLTGVGDKLRPEWLARALLGDAPARPYLTVRMPRFGSAAVKTLAQAFVALDRIADPAVAFDDTAQAREAGRRLVGEGGTNCILCHDFHGRKAPSGGVLDLLPSVERLNPDWFVRVLENPEKYLPGTRMPAFWPAGRSSIPSIMNGDAKAQVRAIWTYLVAGERAVDPEGLSRKSSELFVGGRAVVYRGKLWEAGWRGIAVGYPDRLNLGFDAEQVRLALLWKDRFLDVAKHWHSQGSGLIRPLGRDVRVLPHGRPFAWLADPDDDWPDEEGWRTAPYRFRGYDLNQHNEPTFRYEFMGVNIEDRPRVVVAGTAPYLARELILTATEELEGTWFRAATGRRIESIDGSFLIDDQLTLRFAGAQGRIVAGKDDGFELRVSLPIRAGKSTLTVEYVW